MRGEMFDKGLVVRKEVLGKEYVEKALASADDFSMPMQEYATEACWGMVWMRPGLERKTRSLINLAMIGLNRHEASDGRESSFQQRGDQGRDQGSLAAGRNLLRCAGRRRLIPDRSRSVSGDR